MQRKIKLKHTREEGLQAGLSYELQGTWGGGGRGSYHCRTLSFPGVLLFRADDLRLMLFLLHAPSAIVMPAPLPDLPYTMHRGCVCHSSCRLAFPKCYLADVSSHFQVSQSAVEGSNHPLWQLPKTTISCRNYTGGLSKLLHYCLKSPAL